MWCSAKSFSEFSLEPNPPQNVTVQAVAATIIEVFWDPPSDVDDALLLYNVSWTPADGELRQQNYTSLYAILTGLEPCTRYTVTVTATARDEETGEEATSDPSDPDEDETHLRRKIKTVIKNTRFAAYLSIYCSSLTKHLIYKAFYDT